MHRSAVLALGAWLACSGFALGQGLPGGTFASSKEGCSKLKEKTVTELGQDLDFTVLNKTGISVSSQRCDFLSVTAHNATSWVATAFCEESGSAFPDLFAIVRKPTGDLSVTRMTVQQDSYDKSEDEDPEALSNDLDAAEIDRREHAAGSGNNSAGDQGSAPETPAAHEDQNAYFRCESVKQ